MITEWTLQHTLDEIIPICKANAFPCAKVNSIEDMVKDPQLKHRKMIRDVEDKRFGTVTMSGPVVKMSDTNPDVYCTAPRLGEHNHEILGDLLGFSDEEIAQMKEDGVI